MKKVLSSVIIAFAVFFVNNVIAQTNEPAIITISGGKVSSEVVKKSEFEAIYKKNNQKTDLNDKKSVEEYLDLYINFKLKVREAEELGLDTVKSFVTELGGYRKQLAQPYLTDKEVTSKILEEAYDRMKYDVKCSHILLRIESDALPKDTLAVYNKMLQIRDRILKGEDFGKLAVELSEDPSAKGMEAKGNTPAYPGNKGDLGYFTAFQMVYPFESAAYHTPVGQISMPIRTSFGYHLVKVVDKRPARGQIQVAHIMVRTTDKMSEADKNNAKEKINEIYKKLKNGEDFSDLASRFSDDKGSSGKGGILPAFGTGRMVSEFEEAAYSLKNNNDYTEPFQTIYGWHIIKRIERKNIPTFDEAKNDLKLKISRDVRAQIPVAAVVEKLKKEYNYSYNIKALKSFYKLVDTLIFKSAWAIPANAKLGKKLFAIVDASNNTKAKEKVFTQQDFAKYLESYQTPRKPTDIEMVVNQMYGSFVEMEILNYENSKLESKYPEFKSLMKEYRDGILLFELTDQKVWSKAVKDSAGLQAFYEKNKQQYMWQKRLDATVYTCKNEEIATKVRERMSNKIIQNDILDEINRDSQLNLKIESTVYSKGDNKIVDAIEWKSGLSENIHTENTVVFVDIKEVIQPQPKTLSEAKGQITSDYQNFLEKEWIESLKAKYKVEINKDVLSTVK